MQITIIRKVAFKKWSYNVTFLSFIFKEQRECNQLQNDVSLDAIRQRPASKFRHLVLENINFHDFGQTLPAEGSKNC